LCLQLPGKSLTTHSLFIFSQIFTQIQNAHLVGELANLQCLFINLVFEGVDRFYFFLVFVDHEFRVAQIVRERCTPLSEVADFKDSVVFFAAAIQQQQQAR
jgi:hypothetical protein